MCGPRLQEAKRPNLVEKGMPLLGEGATTRILEGLTSGRSYEWGWVFVNVNVNGSGREGIAGLFKNLVARYCTV